MDINSMLKNMSKKMQDVQKEEEDKRNKVTAVGEAGGGVVKVTLNGNYEIISLYISKYYDEDDEGDVVEEDDDEDNLEILSDLVMAAFNKAKKQVDEMTKTSEGDMLNKMGLPFKMPF